MNKQSSILTFLANSTLTAIVAFLCYHERVNNSTKNNCPGWHSHGLRIEPGQYLSSNIFDRLQGVDFRTDYGPLKLCRCHGHTIEDAGSTSFGKFDQAVLVE
jgi:hypothetical protein